MSKTGEQQPADMEVDSSAAVEEKPAVRFSINGEFSSPPPPAIWPLARFPDWSRLA